MEITDCSDLNGVFHCKFGIYDPTGALEALELKLSSSK